METKTKRLLPLLVVFLAVCAVGFCEIALQVQQYLKARVITHRRYGFFEVDPFLQIRPRRYPKYDRELHVNDDSFRGDPVDMSAGTYRIFTLGGSTTYSYLLPYEETYPARLEAKLKNASPRRTFQVQNASCDWYSTEHSIIRYLFYVRYYKPHLVIINHAVNDLIRSFAPEWWCRPGDAFRRDYSHYLGPVVGLERTRVKYFPFTELLLYKKIRSVFFAPDAAQQLKTLDGEDPDFARKVRMLTHAEPVRDFKSLQTFEENLRTLVRLIRADNVGVIVVTEPSIYRRGLSERELRKLYFAPLHCSERGVFPDVESMEYGMGLFNAVVRKVARELGVPLIDLAAAIPKEEKYFFDDVHPTPAATEIEAQLLAEAVKNTGALEN